MGFGDLHASIVEDQYGHSKLAEDLPVWRGDYLAFHLHDGSFTVSNCSSCVSVVLQTKGPFRDNNPWTDSTDEGLVKSHNRGKRPLSFGWSATFTPLSCASEAWWDTVASDAGSDQTHAEIDMLDAVAPNPINS